MLTRIISGVLMAAAILAVLLLAPAWAMAIVIGAAAFICAAELQGMAHREAGQADRVALWAACIAAVAWPIVQPTLPVYDASRALLLGFFILTIFRLFRPLPIDLAARRLGADGLTLLYLAATFPYIYSLRLMGEGGWVVVLVMAITFGGDIGGYFAGRFLGRHKLYPTVSPKKTVEGALGGLALGFGAALLARAVFPGLGGLSVVDCVVLGIGGVTFGILGDLVESLIKRACGAKDSGTLIPGHGGLLDRIDALLFAGPFCAFYLEAVQPW